MTLVIETVINLHTPGHLSICVTSHFDGCLLALC